jgi:hypothetical protein
MASWFETHGVAVLLTMRVSEEHRKSDASRRMKPLTWETRSIADPRQDGAEGDARQLQRGAFEVEQMALHLFPSSLPISVSAILSVANGGLNAGSSLWRSVETLTWIELPSSL